MSFNYMDVIINVFLKRKLDELSYADFNATKGIRELNTFDINTLETASIESSSIFVVRTESDGERYIRLAPRVSQELLFKQNIESH